MSKYQVAFTEEAAEDLDKIKKYYAREITDRIRTTLIDRAEDVTRSTVKKLRGFETLYRLRVGEYRVFYLVQSGEVIILRVLSKQREAEFYQEARGYENHTDL